MANGPAGSAKQRLLANGDALEGGAVQVYAQARTGQGRRPAPPAKGDVLEAQRLAHQVPIVGAFQVTNVGDAGGEMPARSRQQRRFTHLTTQLIAQTMLAGKL